MPPLYKYFEPSEVEGLDEEFCAKLDQARHIAGFPFKISSGFRTPEANLALVGAVPDSAHCKGLAVDLAVSNSHEVYAIIAASLEVGIDRIGIYVDSVFNPVHIHLDVDKEKVPEVVFIKQEAN